ncbi:MAG: hypothetical protein ABEJ07_01785 [Candidatus Nanohaloarchaea archaeon]
MDGEGKIFLIRDGELREMNEDTYEEESLLQEQIAEYRSLLAGEQVDPENPRRWLLIEREISVPDSEESEGRWSLDHLFIDQEGVPTLVEVKRSQDTRSRRRVVAQMLDYAANSAEYWTPDGIRERFKVQCESQGEDPEDQLAEFLPDDKTPEEFWEEVKTNLAADKIRMLFVADEIPSELRSIVEFLNREMETAEVLAVEIKHYTGEGEQALVPRVIGQTEQARQKKQSSSRRKWDEESFFEDARKKLSEEELTKIKKLYQFSRENADTIDWGTGSQNGSFNPKWEELSDRSIFTVYSNGNITLNFGWLVEDKAVEFKQEFAEELGNAEIDIEVPDSLDDSMSYPIDEDIDGLIQCLENTLNRHC